MPELQKEYNAVSLNKSFEGLRLFNVSQTYPLLVKVIDLATNVKLAKDRDKIAKKLLSFTKAIENFHFINSAIAQTQANVVEMFYADKCAQEVEPDQVLGFMESVIVELNTTKLVTYKEFAPNFTNVNYESDFTLIYYIADRINDYAMRDTNRSGVYNPDKKILKRNHNIDHLIAQSKAQYGFELDGESIHSIGNLLVIDSKLNSSLGNVHIEQKIAILKAESHLLPEVKVLVNQWSDASWDTAKEAALHISKRSEELASRCFKQVFQVKM